MASQQRTVGFIIEQIAGAGVISARKMFGEFGIYCDGKIVALVCDDQLFLKPTPTGKAFIGNYTEAAPYNGAKPYLLIDGDKWDDGDWLTEFFRVSAEALPVPKPIKKKKK